MLARALEPTGPKGKPPRPASPARILAQSLDRQVAAVQSALGWTRDPAPEPMRVDPSPALANPQFWEVWLLHRDYLHRHSLRYSNGNAADAEDAMSDAMLKAATAFQSTAIRNQRAWLLRLVHNACMDRHRGHQRQKRMIKDVAHEGDYLFPIVAPQRDRSPEEWLSAFQFVAELQQALDDLPRSLAEPLMLYLDERPDAEIAGNLNVTKEVIRKRRQMARDWLRRRLLG